NATARHSILQISNTNSHKRTSLQEKSPPYSNSASYCLLQKSSQFTFFEDLIVHFQIKQRLLFDPQGLDYSRHFIVNRIQGQVPLQGYTHAGQVARATHPRRQRQPKQANAERCNENAIESPILIAQPTNDSS